MKYVCDAPGGNTWFRIETEAEAGSESDGMRHAVEKFFRKEQEKATQTFHPLSKVLFEQEIGLKAHIQREMPLFLTLRDDEGNPLVTAMLPPGGQDDRSFRPIIVGMANADPYVDHADAIKALGQHFGLTLERGRCYPIAAIDTRRRSSIPNEGAKRVEILRRRERLAPSARCFRAARHGAGSSSR